MLALTFTDSRAFNMYQHSNNSAIAAHLGTSRKFQLSLNKNSDAITMSLHPNTPIPSATPSLTYPATPAYSSVLSGQGEASSKSITIKKPTFDAASSIFQRLAVQNTIPGETSSKLGPGRTLSTGEHWEERGIGVLTHFLNFK
jgi:hypothetical protein